jgi:PAS domain S-box-containing protein
MSKKIIKLYCLILLFAWCSVWITCVDDDSTFRGNVPLTEEERQWLEAHPIVKIAPAPHWPPGDFFDEDGNYRGMTKEYLQILEENLDIKFEIVKLETWDECIQNAKSREIDIISSAARSPERAEYMLFTKPYLTLPAVILVRTENPEMLTLGNLRDKSVAVVQGYATQEYIETYYPDIDLVPVPDTQTGLNKLSFGAVDAMVSNVATATYYIRKEGILNLRVAGNTGYNWKVTLMSRKDWPQLNSILDKGLMSITPEQRQEIYNNWVYLEQGKSVFTKEELIALFLIIAIGTALFMVIMIWNWSLKRKVDQKTKELKIELLERKKAEERIRKSEERLRTILYTSNEGFWEIDNKGLITHLNPEMCSILDAEKSEIMGHSIFEFVDKENADIFRSQMKKREYGEKSSYEITLKRPHNAEVHCLFNATPLFDEAGNKTGAFAMVTDITERKKAEKKLLDTRNYLKNVFNSMPSMLISVNAQGVITEWNTAAEEYTGIPAIKAISRKVWEVVPFLTKYKEDFREVVTSHSQEIFQRERVGLQDKKYVNISMSPLIFNENDGAVIRVDDVTELEKKDQQLRQAQKMETVGNLAGGLAHDFNNVLGGILGMVSLIKYMLDTGDIKLDEFRSDVNAIEKASQRAADMVNQLLALSRKHELTFVPVDINYNIKAVLKICKNTFDKSININVNHVEEKALIMGDPAQLQQVLLNLCINASHAMTLMRQEGEPQGGTLTIAIEKINADKYFCATHPEAIEGGYWILSVGDTGVGMDSRTLTKIFDPFFTTKEKFRGTGLGLAMVYNIIKQHKGFIDVYSEPGVGTTFNIFLPVLENVDELSDMNDRDAEIPKGKGLILIVDDEEIMRLTAQRILEACGYDTILATDGEEAVKIFREAFDEITAVVLDMAMPTMSGKEAYREMKRIYPQIKVLMASGFKQDKRIQDAMEMGVNGFIKKPYTMKELGTAIKKVLD